MVDSVVEPLAHVVAVQRGAGLVGACLCLLVTLDVCGGTLPGAFEVLGRCFELHDNGVMTAAGRLSAADAAVVEVVLGAGVAPPRLLVEVRRRQRLASRGGCRLDLYEVAFGGGGLRCKSSPPRPAGREGPLGVEQVAAQPGSEWFEPLRYLTA